MKTPLTLIMAVLMISGCTPSQTVTPVAVGLIEGRQVCIVENPKVRQGFLEAMKQALVDKGYEVRVLEPSTSLNTCPVTATYTANWRWSQLIKTVYMAYAEIKVHNYAKPVGEAIYDSRDMGNQINTEEKARELVKQLFPDWTGS